MVFKRLACSPVDVLWNSLESLCKNHITIKEIRDNVQILVILFGHVVVLEEVLLEGSSQVVLEAFDIVVGFFFVTSVTGDICHDWAGVWIKIIGPLVLCQLILNIGMDWKVHIALSNCFKT